MALGNIGFFGSACTRWRILWDIPLFFIGKLLTAFQWMSENVNVHMLMLMLMLMLMYILTERWCPSRYVHFSRPRCLTRSQPRLPASWRWENRNSHFVFKFNRDPTAGSIKKYQKSLAVTKWKVLSCNDVSQGRDTSAMTSEKDHLFNFSLQTKVQSPKAYDLVY